MGHRHFLTETIRQWYGGTDAPYVTVLSIGLNDVFFALLETCRQKKTFQQLDFVALVSESFDPQEISNVATKDRERLLSQWPDRMPGMHQMDFDAGAVRLTIIFDEATEVAKKLALRFDALLVPDEAGEHIHRLARLAKPDASVFFNPANIALSENLRRVGFVSDSDNTGVARMMRARTRGEQAHRAIRDVIVVGAGLSGANAAFELASRGVNVRVIDAHPVPGAAASALAWGILHPHYSRDDNLLAQISRDGFFATRARLKHLEEKTGERLFNPLGCLQMAHTEEIATRWQEACEKSLPFVMPSDYARLLTREEASDRVGVTLRRGGWWFEKAGLVRVGAYCRALIEAYGIAYRGNTEVVALRPKDDSWQLIGPLGEVIDEARDVVIAASMNTTPLLDAHQTIALTPLKGRITLLRDTDLIGLKAPVSGDGYVVKTDDGFCAVGATYELDQTGPWTAEKAHSANLDKLEILFENTPCSVVTGAYQGVRAVAHARVPVVGPVYDEASYLAKCEALNTALEINKAATIPGLWVMAGMGSRGVSLSALMSKVLASEMLGVPAPLFTTAIKGVSTRRLLQTIL